MNRARNIKVTLVVVICAVVGALGGQALARSFFFDHHCWVVNVELCVPPANVCSNDLCEFVVIPYPVERAVQSATGGQKSIFLMQEVKCWRKTYCTLEPGIGCRLTSEFDEGTIILVPVGGVCN